MIEKCIQSARRQPGQPWASSPALESGALKIWMADPKSTQVSVQLAALNEDKSGAGTGSQFGVARHIRPQLYSVGLMRSVGLIFRDTNNGREQTFAFY